MLYSKQEWFKTKAEMNEIFADIPEALDNTLEVLDKVETYSIDHAPIMPNFAIPKSFGTEEEYHQRFSDEELFEEFTRDENGNVVLADEMLTPDSSRFWPMDGYVKGKSQPSYDKQYVRDWLKANPDKGYVLPQEVIDATIAKYAEAYELLTGEKPF
jgi:DNA polymerase-3 subunit alpha